jgi:hypothetical protein
MKAVPVSEHRNKKLSIISRFVFKYFSRNFSMKESSQAVSNSVSAVSVIAIFSLATTSFAAWQVSNFFKAIADGLSGDGPLIGVSLLFRVFDLGAKAVSVTSGVAAIGLTAVNTGLIA